MDQNANILIVDDDAGIREILSEFLSAAGYRVRTAGNGDEMYRHIKLQRPDLIILDLNMPGKHGLELARELRAESDMGIIILTGNAETVDRIVGLEIGADDYIPKPFDRRELLARVRSVLRRVMQAKEAAPSPDRSVATFSGWKLDLGAQELRSPAGAEVRLTSYEFQLLAALVQSANRVLSRDQIKEKVTGRDWLPTDRSVDVLVGKLRKKIEKDPHRPALIKTVRGSGYKFTAQVMYS